jgi:hypothetical protein
VRAGDDEALPCDPLRRVIGKSASRVPATIRAVQQSLEHDICLKPELDFRLKAAPWLDTSRLARVSPLSWRGGFE